ncbi:hypothetical protein BaRGS_00036377 [Batillaria attramentaria]|uniref:Uncharacterized protein n=1 Tax=Batillaria attramentaria TaxID=370345 RepID=A0ABD0JBG2_9CAEN
MVSCVQVTAENHTRRTDTIQQLTHSARPDPGMLSASLLRCQVHSSCKLWRVMTESRDEPQFDTEVNNQTELRQSWRRERLKGHCTNCARGSFEIDLHYCLLQHVSQYLRVSPQPPPPSPYGSMGREQLGRRGQQFSSEEHREWRIVKVKLSV